MTPHKEIQSAKVHQQPMPCLCLQTHDVSLNPRRLNCESGLSLDTKLGLMGGRQLSPHGEVPCALLLQLT